MPRNIVVCCDGTNNQIAGNQTNVLRLFRMLEIDDARQLAFYDAGVGTNADPTAQWWWRRRMHKALDGGIGVSIRDNVLKGYRFLVDQYEPDDRIFLFGFSRGAYTARAIAAMIKQCGLLWPNHGHLAAHAWSVFTDEDRGKDKRAQYQGPARIKKTFSRRVKIHFVGAWDTVSSFGWFWDLLTIPYTRSNDAIENIRHAVSVDERRTCFAPNLVSPTQGQDCLEVWFPGVHADVGGGYPDKEAGLARISLNWMLREACAKGLLVDSDRQLKMIKPIGVMYRFIARLASVVQPIGSSFMSSLQQC